jgi:hypothetical protein
VVGFVKPWRALVSTGRVRLEPGRVRKTLSGSLLNIRPSPLKVKPF